VKLISKYLDSEVFRVHFSFLFNDCGGTVSRHKIID